MAAVGGRDSRRRGPNVGHIVAMTAALVVAAAGVYRVATAPRRVHRAADAVTRVADARVAAESADARASSEWALTSTVVSTSTSTTTTAVVTSPAVPVAVSDAAVHPTQVMVIGDSGTWDMYPALERGFGAAGIPVRNASFPGEGLTTPAGIRHLWYDAAEWWHADYFVVSIGTWDDAFIAWHGWEAYLDEVDDTVRTLTRHGEHVLWLSMLPSDDLEPDAHAKPRVQDRLYASLPSRYPGVVDYLDISSALTAPDGTSPRVVDGRLLRKPDGWHLCPDGAAAVAHAVLAHLGIDSDGWDHGPWRRDPRYDDPPGACPAR